MSALGRHRTVLWAALALGACALPEPAPDAAAPSDVGIDAGPLTPVDQLDLLLMVDDSSSMTEEQQHLATALPAMLAALTSGDLDGDGTPEHAPVRSMHVGIVDSDMGLGDVVGIGTCDASGDDGVMQTGTTPAATGCMDDYASTYGARYFSWAAGGSRPLDIVAHDVGCAAAVGTDGCGFEFQLESPLKALSLAPTPDGGSPVGWTAPGYVPPAFYGGAVGHGGDPATNGGFLREGSALAILLVSDEDDCATPNPHIFAIDDPRYDGIDLGLRCHVFASELHPVSRYVDGFAGLRADPRRIAYGVLAGVPTAVAGMSPAVILADPGMQDRPDPSIGNQLQRACSSGDGVAFPARRMTSVAQRLAERGAQVTVQSICQPDFAAPLGAFALAIERTLR